MKIRIIPLFSFKVDNQNWLFYGFILLKKKGVTVCIIINTYKSA